MPHSLFDRENSELLHNVTRLSLRLVDRAVGSMPPKEGIPAEEVAAMTRLIGASLSLVAISPAAYVELPDDLADHLSGS